MDIKRLLTRGGEPFAAEIVDNTEKYNVFLEALGNNVILPELLKSGWKLVSLPLSLSKNGIALEDLPQMEYSPSIDEELEMHDCMGEPMPMDERRKLLSVEDVRSMQSTGSSYVIQTREEFLQYLKRTAELKLPEDFLPINCFVHPSALFTYDEYTDPANREWIHLLRKRRRLSYAQFLNLRQWALERGLNEDFTPLDFVSFYFQWGICGLSTQILSKERIDTTIRHNLAPSGDLSMRRVVAYDYGLIDRFQREYRTSWTEGYKIFDPQTVLRDSASLKDNDTLAIKLCMPKSEMIEEWKTVDADIKFSPNYLIVGNMPADSSLYVTGKYGVMLPRYWNPSAEKEMNEDMFLHAMAEEFIERRTVKGDYTSYRALCESGCSPQSALFYIRDKSGWRREILEDETKLEALKEAGGVVVTDEDVRAFLSDDGSRDNTGDMEGDAGAVEAAEAAERALKEAFEGVVNVDRVQRGVQADMNAKADEVYAMLYCVHNILGVPLNEIYKTLADFDGHAPIRFTDGEKTVRIPCEPIDHAYKGFLEDKKNYRREQAETAYSFLWVDAVARELGPESAGRHIAVRCYRATRDVIAAPLVLLQMEYNKRVEERIPNIMDQNDAKQLSSIFAANAFFSGAMRGFYTYPEGLGSDVVRLDPEKRQKWRGMVEGPFVEDTVSITDDILDAGDACAWRTYCVNAVILPTEVRPRMGFSLRETSLIATWYASEGLTIQPELIKRGLIRAGDTNWGYLAQMYPLYVVRGEGSEDLTSYFKKAEEFLANFDRTKHFTGVPHILEIQYPRFAREYGEEPAQANEEYAFKVGYGKVLSYKSDNNEPETVEAVYAPIKKFDRLTAEDFYYTGGNVTLPTNIGKKPMRVSGTSVFVGDEEIRLADVEYLPGTEYPVTHLCGRRYLLCDMYSTIWVVEV